MIQRQGITSANELSGYTERELRSFPNLGAASVTAIKKALHALDFHLGDTEARKRMAQKALDAEEAADPDRDPRLRQPKEHNTEIREVELAAKHWMWLENCAQILGCTVEYYLTTIIAKAWAKDEHQGRTFGRQSQTMKRADFEDYRRRLEAADDGL